MHRFSSVSGEMGKTQRNFQPSKNKYKWMSLLKIPSGGIQKNKIKKYGSICLASFAQLFYVFIIHIVLQKSYTKEVLVISYLIIFVMQVCSKIKVVNVVPTNNMRQVFYKYFSNERSSRYRYVFELSKLRRTPCIDA